MFSKKFEDLIVLPSPLACFPRKTVSYAGVLKRVKDHIYGQFESDTAQRELASMGPEVVDWNARTLAAIESILPRLPQLAEQLVENVPRRLSSPNKVLQLLKAGETFVRQLADTKPEVTSWYEQLLRAAVEAKDLVGHLESQQVSAEIQRFIISEQGLGDIVFSNGNSIYPDLVLKSHDYEMLSKQSRKAPIDGPCLRGKRPSNVPDGCEIKTNRGKRIKVDAHGAHAGLHLGVTWDFEDDDVVITGVWAGYVREGDHRESGRNVNVTTVKYSFGHDLFVTLLPEA